VNGVNEYAALMEQ